MSKKTVKTDAITVSSRTKAETRRQNLKTARTRRQRGYHWEDTLVKRFNSLNGWKAFRLGSPSIGLPDVLAISSRKSSLFTIEAKSGTQSSLMVPYDQINRCLKWTDAFDLYKNRKVILAFKFLAKKRIGKSLYESRELREFFKEWDHAMEVTDCVCTYEGRVFALKEGKREKLDLSDCKMPFFQ